MSSAWHSRRAEKTRIQRMGLKSQSLWRKASNQSESIPYARRNRNPETGTKMIFPRLKSVEANIPFEGHVPGAGAQSLTEPHSKTHSPKHGSILKQWTHFQLLLLTLFFWWGACEKMLEPVISHSNSLWLVSNLSDTEYRTKVTVPAPCSHECKSKQYRKHALKPAYSWFPIFVTGLYT